MYSVMTLPLPLLPSSPSSSPLSLSSPLHSLPLSSPTPLPLLPCPSPIPTAPSAPTSFGVVSFVGSSLTVSWGQPEQLNGMFVGLYGFRYGEEAIFASSALERPLFASQFVIGNVQRGVVYRVEVRASTISLTGETLWGPYAVLRVIDGMGIGLIHDILVPILFPTGTELEVPTTQATLPPSTQPSTEPPSTEPPSTEPPSTEPPSTEPPSTEPPSTEPPSTEPPSTEPPSTEPPSTEPPSTEAPSTEPPSTQAPSTEPPSTDPPSTEPPSTDPPTPDPFAPTSVPIGVTALNVRGTSFGEVFVYWRVSWFTGVYWSLLEFTDSILRHFILCAGTFSSK